MKRNNNLNVASQCSCCQGKKYIKALDAMQKMLIEEQQKKIEKSEQVDRTLAKMEFLIQRYKDILASIIQVRES